MCGLEAILNTHSGKAAFGNESKRASVAGTLLLFDSGKQGRDELHSSPNLLLTITGFAAFLPRTTLVMGGGSS